MLPLWDAAAVIFRGISSVGRAPALHAGGQEFESPILHGYILKFMVKFYKNAFPKYVPKVTWGDCIDKISQESMINIAGRKPTYVSEHLRWIADAHEVLPTYIMTGEPRTDYPLSLAQAWHEIKSVTNALRMDVLISFAKNSQTYGRHNDTMDVLITQAIGQMSYKFDDGVTHVLSPGDAIFIPKGTYHDPITTGPRVTLSVSKV